MGNWRRVLHLVLGLVLLVPGVARADSPAPLDVTELARRARPSVVGILVTVPSEDPSQPQGNHGAGTGFVYKEGVILTNAHVVQDAVQVQILWNDGTVVQVEDVEAKVRWDEVTDIGIIRVDTQDRPPLSLGASDAVAVGEPVVAIGNPLGFRLGNTVTRGILSGTGRAVGTGLPFLQHDAPINPGNSGGPLFNDRGQVIGINSAKFADVGVEGLSLAIPIDLGVEIAEELLRRGKVERAWLGLFLAEDWRGYFGVPNAEGVEVVGVVPDGPAGLSGIHPGDKLLRIDDHPIGTQDDVHAYLLHRRPGETVTLTLKRQGQVLQTRVTLRSRDALKEETVAQSSGALGGIWTRLTPSQVREAAEYGHSLAYQGLEELSQRYLAQSGSARAVLYTEFAYVARRVVSAYWATGRRPSDRFELAAADAIRGQVELLVEATLDRPDFFAGAQARLRQGEITIPGALQGAGYAVAVDGSSVTGQAVFRFPTEQLDPAAPVEAVIALEGGPELVFRYSLKELR